MTSREHISLVGKVEDSLLDLGLAGFKSPLVLMVSGGSDSVALLLLIHELCLKARGNVSNLLVLHVNHQLRGAEANADEDFVNALCAELAVNCNIERVSVAAFAKETGASLEQAGRILRYKLAEAGRVVFSAELAATQKSAARPPQESCDQQSYILTAHTADDRAETLLQRLIVGGGSGSLSSIPKRNGFVTRPLLDCTKQELRAWLTVRDLKIDGRLWCEDATNLDTTYSRAFVRHELIPLLAKRNPRIIEGLNRTAEMLTSESAWMDEQAARLLPLTKESFAAPLPVLRRALYLACNQAIQELAPEARITFEHIDLIAREGSRNGFACQIPGGIEIRTKHGQIQFKKAKPPKHSPDCCSRPDPE